MEWRSYEKHDNTKSLKKVNKVRKGEIRMQSNKKGFAFLNEIFCRRYRTVMGVKPVITSIVLVFFFLLFALDLFIEYSQDFGQQAAVDSLVNNIINYLTFGSYQDTLKPLITGSAEFENFFMEVFDSHLLLLFPFLVGFDATTKMTQTMFINCDRSLMSFSFYKEPSKIAELYKIRLREAVKLNLAPAITLGIISSTMVFLFGGQRYFGQYLLIPAAYVLMTALFSVHLMTLYYLLQPYTENIKIKNHFHTVITFISGTLVFILCWIPVRAWLLVPILAALLALYVFCAAKLVRKYSPKHWRVRT